MFDSMGAALKKHIGKIKVHQYSEGSPQEEKGESADEEAKEKSSDYAPSIGDKHPLESGHGGGLSSPAAPLQTNPGFGPGANMSPDEHAKIMAALAGHGSPVPQDKLGIRASANMKEKMASIEKHKKQI